MNVNAVFYRLRQFIWAINPKITSEDIQYIKENLNKNEINLFCKLSKAEQKHSIKVSKDINKMCVNKENINKNALVKVGLMHDIGKIEKSVNIFSKSIIVILNKITQGKLKSLDTLDSINIYYNHGKIGANILKDYGYDKRFLYLIENHHNDNIKDDIELNIIKICDDRN